MTGLLRFSTVPKSHFSSLCGTARTPFASMQLCPHPVADLSHERIMRRPVLGGLINEYERAG